jgi:hypothetical protein
MWTQGHNAFAPGVSYAQTAEFLKLAAEFGVLAAAWDSASAIRTGQQQARQGLHKGPVTIGEALQQPGVPGEQLERIAGRSLRPPEPQMIADIARRLETDVTTCYPSIQVLRPIAVALAAASAFERRGELPAADTVAGVMAHHVVANMAAREYEADAVGNGFGRGWPRETLETIARQLKRPLPRLAPQVPDRRGSLI